MFSLLPGRCWIALPLLGHRARSLLFLLCCCPNQRQPATLILWSISTCDLLVRRFLPVNSLELLVWQNCCLGPGCLRTGIGGPGSGPTSVPHLKCMRWGSGALGYLQWGSRHSSFWLCSADGWQRCQNPKDTDALGNSSPQVSKLEVRPIKSWGQCLEADHAATNIAPSLAWMWSCS